MRHSPPRHTGLPRIRLTHGTTLLGCAALLALGAAALPPSTAGQSTVAGILRAHCRAREATVTLRARFVQTKVFEALGEQDRSSGVLYYRKPDTVRWQYFAPETSWTVLNGGKGLSVFPRIRQAQKFDLQQSQAEAVLSIVGFGTCGKDLQTAFVVTAAAKGASQVLTLKPREPGIAARFERIELTLDPRDHLPRRVVLHETSGNTLWFEFRDLERGVRIEERLFEHEIPGGYEVVG